MATGGNFSRTLEGGHEMFYDFSCSLCEEESKHVEAVKYCEECFVYLCDHCLRNHNKYPLHKRHQLLNQSQFATVNKSALVSFPTKRCPKHPGELINIFCGNHDVVCCSVCKALAHSRIDKDKNYLKTTKSKANDILKKLESFKGDNECDLFVQVKTGSQFVNDAVQKVRVILEAEEKPSIQFEINRNIEEYFSSLKSFGCFSSTGTIATPPQYSTYTIPKCEKFDIVEKCDAETCDIWRICQLSDGTFLITDWNNNKLKRLDQSLKLLDSVELLGKPRSVCPTGHGQAAVSLGNKIQFISVGKKLEPTRSFTVGNVCGGIVCIGNELFVCCGDMFDASLGCIEVYDNGGKLQRTIPRDQKCLPSVPRSITVSDDSQHLLVSSFFTSVITVLDLAGNVVNTFSHKELREPTEICTDGRGQVFVCGCNSNTVVQLSPKTQKVDIILKEEGGINNPQGIFYDREQSRLLVSCRNKNELFSFPLKK